MASVLKVDKLDPQSGTALEIGTSGDTVTVPTGAGLTVTDEVKTNKISPATGAAFALGDSGDTFTVPSGATIVNSGTATGFGGGKVLQVQYANIEVDQSTSSTSYVATTLTDQITPSATSSKIFILVSGGRASYATGNVAGDTSLYRQIDGGGYSSITTGTLSHFFSGIAYGKLGVALNYVDSPSTTSAVDYTIYIKTDANTYYWNSASSMVGMTLMEIGA
jgi:hypothetical protein